MGTVIRNWHITVVAVLLLLILTTIQPCASDIFAPCIVFLCMLSNKLCSELLYTVHKK